MSHRDVLWITLESVRQDHTSLGSTGRDTTPNLAALASEGQSFRQCFSHDIWTRSSSASILTGQAPSAHQTWSNEASLPDAVPTIPEAFSAAGYRTVCVSPNGQLSPATGLDRGFEDFHYLIRSTLLEEAGPRALARWLLGWRKHTGGLTTDGSQHCLGYLINRIAKRQIDRAAGDDPLFLYVHHGDSHHAYVPPLAWRDQFRESLPMSIAEAVQLALAMSDNLHACVADEDPFTDEQWRALSVLYDTTIAYVDHLVGNLVEHARERLSDPVVVVTSDHGELLGEGGLLAHMIAANTAVSNVPLVVDGLEGTIPNGLIQHADVMRMLCADLGVDHGVPIGRDLRRQPREVAITQRSGARARSNLEAIREHNPEFDAERYHAADLTSVRTSRWRYQSSGQWAQLFDLPDERSDVSDAYPDVVARMDARLREWVEAHGHPTGEAGTADFDDETKSHLRDLGYLQ